MNSSEELKTFSIVDGSVIDLDFASKQSVTQELHYIEQPSSSDETSNIEQSKQEFASEQFITKVESYKIAQSSTSTETSNHEKSDKDMGRFVDQLVAREMTRAQQSSIAAHTSNIEQFASPQLIRRESPNGVVIFEHAEQSTAGVQARNVDQSISQVAFNQVQESAVVVQNNNVYQFQPRLQQSYAPCPGTANIQQHADAPVIFNGAIPPGIHIDPSTGQPIRKYHLRQPKAPRPFPTPKRVFPLTIAQKRQREASTFAPALKTAAAKKQKTSKASGKTPVRQTVSYNMACKPPVRHVNKTPSSKDSDIQTTINNPRAYEKSPGEPSGSQSLVSAPPSNGESFNDNDEAVNNGPPTSKTPKTKSPRKPRGIPNFPIIESGIYGEVGTFTYKTKGKKNFSELTGIRHRCVFLLPSGHLCHKTFADDNCLKRHQLEHFVSEKCPLCPKLEIRFHRSDYIQKHWLKKHEKVNRLELAETLLRMYRHRGRKVTNSVMQWLFGEKYSRSKKDDRKRRRDMTPEEIAVIRAEVKTKKEKAKAEWEAMGKEWPFKEQDEEEEAQEIDVEEDDEEEEEDDDGDDEEEEDEEKEQEEDGGDKGNEEFGEVNEADKTAKQAIGKETLGETVNKQSDNVSMCDAATEVLIVNVQQADDGLMTRVV